MSNKLVNASSPYLLQHADNPVDWHEWGDAAFEKARSENKLVLISVGYSACHWCHVMAHECFEDPAVADLMNSLFVNIKVDREERPDIDQIYMSAVQLLTGSGGWPLNCFALPDGRPVYGGTYFPRLKWIELLQNLSMMYTNDRTKVEQYAAELARGAGAMQNLVKQSTEPEAAIKMVDQLVEEWTTQFDKEHGGPDRAPKFPLPNNYQFLFLYGSVNNNTAITGHVLLTLKKMCQGGIFDQLAGGFARYSVDRYWKVPHFEKMLYDNAQLLSLYATAYQITKDPEFKEVVRATFDWLQSDLDGGIGNYFAALDADTEGDEGKFYIWNEQELQAVLGDDFELAKSYYGIGENGYWEHGNNVLLKDKSARQLSELFGLSVEVLQDRLVSVQTRLLAVRNQRKQPSLDDKTLCSWNALLITGLADAYDAFGDTLYLDKAIQIAQFIERNMTNEEGGLWHTWKQKPSVPGFLEDYAFLIQAYIRLYQVTFDRKWLDAAKAYCFYVLDHFYDEESLLFFFTDDITGSQLFTRAKEIQDNVIPASNSQMALNLWLLGRYFDMEHWMTLSESMLKAVLPMMKSYGSAWSNWMILSLLQHLPPQELVICGENAKEIRREFAQNYHPELLLAGCTVEDLLPLTTNRTQKGKTLIYRCVNKACQLPVTELSKAIEDI